MKDGWYFEPETSEYWEVGTGGGECNRCHSLERDLLEKMYAEGKLVPACVNYWRYPDRDGMPTEDLPQGYIVDVTHYLGSGRTSGPERESWPLCAFRAANDGYITLIRYMPAPPLEGE